MNILKKPFALGILAVVIMLLVAGGTVMLLSYVANKDGSSELAPEQTKSADEHKADAEKALDDATKNEQAGETAAAIKNYEAAQAAYREAGDTAGEEAVKLQIEYLKKVE